MTRITFVLFFSICFFSLNYLSAQILINGLVIDAQTQSSMPYVNIGVIGTTTGTVSSPSGTFSLYLEEGISKTSIVRFSFIGYEPKEYSAADLSQKDTLLIPLTPSIFELSTIEVKPRFVSTKEIGHGKIDTRMKTNFAISKRPNQNLGAAIGRKFKIKESKAVADTFGFFIAQNNFDEVRFRVEVFSLRKGKPHKNLNSSDIIISVKNKKCGWIEVDLRPYNIEIKDDVAVAIEWVYHSENGSSLSLPITMPTLGTHFYKYGSQGNWKRFRGMSTAMFLKYGL